MNYSLIHPYGKPSPLITPFCFIGGDGHYLIGEDGHSYFNAASCLWNLSFGFQDQIKEAIHTQLEKLPYSTLFYFTNDPAVTLSQRLIDITEKKYTHTYLSSSGSAANEVALKVAQLYQELCGNKTKKVVLSFDQAYHGTSYTTLSASHIEKARCYKYFKSLENYIEIKYPYCYRCPFGKEKSTCKFLCLNSICDYINQNKSDISTLLIEPILGSAGIIVPPKGFFEELSDCCKENNIIIVSDEIATGMGRCGEILISDTLGIDADIVTLSKGVNGGYLPVGVTLFSEKIIEVLHQQNAIIPHGSSQDGNPLSCAAGIVTIDILKNNHICQNVKKMGQYLMEQLSTQIQTNKNVGEIRGSGLMIGIELVKDKITKRRLSNLTINKIYATCFELGLLVYTFESGISLFPPLDLSESEADIIVQKIEQAINSICI